MCKQNQQHIEVANKLEKYCDYGNPPGLNNLLIEAAELLRNPQQLEVANKLEKYCGYGNPSGLNNLLIEAAELLRNSQPIQQEEENN